MTLLPALAAALFFPAAAWAADCPAADPNDDRPDDAALQACLDRGGLTTLVAGSPGYLLSRGLRLSRDGTVLTSRPLRARRPPPRPADGTEPLGRSGKAVILAAPELGNALLAAPNGRRDYRLSNLIFDGNLPNRARRSECRDGGGNGPNLSLEGAGFHVHDIESIRAMCGSAMVVLGRDFVIEKSLIADNGLPREGAPGVSAPWADGMTVLRCERGVIRSNTFVDNTDIALVLGGGPGCRVERNSIIQARKHGFAGLNVGNFNDNGDHAGSVYERNSVTSAPDMLVWGILLGSHPWSRQVRVRHAGVVRGNRSRGAMVNLAVDGIEDGLFENNVSASPQGSYGYGTSGPGAEDGCRKAEHYTAADFGKAKLQAGFVSRAYHDGDCPDVPLESPGSDRDPADAPETAAN